MGLESKGSEKPNEGLFDKLVELMIKEAEEMEKREAKEPDRERFTTSDSVDSDLLAYGGAQKKRGSSIFKAGAKAVVAAGKMKRRVTSSGRRKTVKDDIVEEETF